jgi:ATP/maltotriose-dependent transcriptional regulator MalT
VAGQRCVGTLLRRSEGATLRRRGAWAEPLTGRELELLRLLAAGRSNQRIAHDLALDTVKTHVTHVLGKLGAANRTEVADRAQQLGVIP